MIQRDRSIEDVCWHNGSGACVVQNGMNKPWRLAFIADTKHLDSFIQSSSWKLATFNTQADAEEFQEWLDSVRDALREAGK